MPSASYQDLLDHIDELESENEHLSYRVQELQDEGVDINDGWREDYREACRELADLHKITQDLIEQCKRYVEDKVQGCVWLDFESIIDGYEEKEWDH